jgi:FO synthase
LQQQWGENLSDSQALALADNDDTAVLAAAACALRDGSHGNLITYSRKVFIPLTQLCRDVCHYCTFAQTPSNLDKPFRSLDEVLTLCREGAALGCQEALFTLGEKPELRYKAAREALAELGFESTLDYVIARNWPDSTYQRRQHERRRDRPFAASQCVHGHHAGVGVDPAL